MSVNALKSLLNPNFLHQHTFARTNRYSLKLLVYQLLPLTCTKKNLEPRSSYPNRQLDLYRSLIWRESCRKERKSPVGVRMGGRRLHGIWEVGIFWEDAIILFLVSWNPCLHAWLLERVCCVRQRIRPGLVGTICVYIHSLWAKELRKVDVRLFDDVDSYGGEDVRIIWRMDSGRSPVLRDIVRAMKGEGFVSFR